MRRFFVVMLDATACVIAGTILSAAYVSRARRASLAARLSDFSDETEVDLAETDTLPPPAARYFRKALRPGQRIVRRARFAQRGEILVGTDAPEWRRFTAVETMSSGGFVWDARVRIFSALVVRVCDAFVDGRGSIRANVLGIVPVVRAEGTPELDGGALMRYLAEAVWMPTALLPSNGITWTAVNDTTSRATITRAGVTASLDFVFGDDGLVSHVIAASRPRADGGRFVPTPWQGRFREYAEIDGMLIPRCAEVEWVMAGTPRPYWRGTITRVALDYVLSRP